MTTLFADFLELRVVRRARLIWWHGVLTQALPVALMSLVLMSWYRHVWPAWWEVKVTVVGAIVSGVLIGLLRLDRLEQHRSDGIKRCADCGDPLPAHTSWCPAMKSRIS